MQEQLQQVRPKSRRSQLERALKSSGKSFKDVFLGALAKDEKELEVEKRELMVEENHLLEESKV